MDVPARQIAHSTPAQPSPALLAVLLAVLTLAVYWSAGGFDFVFFDDNVYVYDNPRVREGLSLASVHWAAGAFHSANWHPATWLSHMLDVELFGLHAGRHHLVNILFHTANTLLLFFIWFRMTGAPWACFALAALFAVHPLHVESVAWIAERKDVLSTFFGLLTVGAYLSFLRQRNTAWYLAMAALYAISLMAKPMLVTLPFVLLLLDHWPLGRTGGPVRWSKRLAEKLPLMAMAAGASMVTVAAQAGAGAIRHLADLPLGERLANAALAYVRYIQKTFWPFDLAAYYPHAPVSAAAAGGALVFLAFGSLAALGLGRRHPYLLVGWLWFLGTLVPVIGLVQVGSQAMADRYTYVPLVGIFIMAVWGCRGWLAGRGPALHWSVGAAWAVAIGLLGVQATNQLSVWQNTETLSTRMLAVTENNHKGWHGLGLVRLRQGRHEEAVRCFRRALAVRSEDSRTLHDLALAQMGSGDVTAALESLDRALALAPGTARVLNTLGVALIQLGRQGAAVERFRQAVAADPDYALARSNLDQALKDLPEDPLLQGTGF